MHPVGVEDEPTPERAAGVLDGCDDLESQAVGLLAFAGRREFTTFELAEVLADNAEELLNE